MTLKITIIGAGISGLVTAILLKEAGINVHIIEKRSHVHPLGGGLGIWPNGSKVLLNLPCAEKILALTQYRSNITTGDANGNTLATDSEDIFLNVNGYPVLNVFRSELHQILLDNLGSENVTFGTQCNQIEQIGNKIILSLDNDEKDEVDLLIGADGVHSSVRKIIFPEIQTGYTGYIQLVGSYRSSQNISTHNFIWGKKRYCITLPICKTRNELYLVRPYPRTKLADATCRREEIQLFRGWSTEVDDILDSFENCINEPEFSSHYYCGESFANSPLPKWHSGRIVLVGDAAHGMGSIMALGTSLALENCQALVQALVENNDIETAIHHFEEQKIYRAHAFFQYEEVMTKFLLNANQSEYNDFIDQLRHNSLTAFIQPLIDLLKSHTQEIV